MNSIKNDYPAQENYIPLKGGGSSSVFRFSEFARILLHNLFILAPITTYEVSL